jgi:inorganic triphosphatase YgiF
MNDVRPAPDPRSRGTAVESELKLVIDPSAVAALRDHAALKPLRHGRVRSARVVTTYHDTPDRRLARRGVALRVRRDGRRWLMSVKGAPLAGTSVGVVDRPEIEWRLSGPTLDLARLASTPWRSLFAKTVQRDGLVPVFTTDVERTSLPLAFPDGTTATLAIDVGAVELARPATRRAASSRIAEIELELRGGDSRRLLELASELAADLPLRVEPRSKAERGFALADGVRDAPVRAREIVHADDATAGGAIAAILAECIRQVSANAIGFHGARLDDPEWVHQMRIAVRRLRSCCTLARDLAEDDLLAPVVAGTRWVLDALGPARDLDVFVLETLPAVLADRERASAGEETLAALRALERAAARRRRAADRAAIACVASSRFTCFVIAASRLAASLAAYGLAGPGERRHGGARAFAARLLERRARRLAKAGVDLDHAGVEARHALRIAAKKLRYATEFFATLFPRRRTRIYRDALAALQDELGVFNDAAIASRVAGVLAGPTAAATIAIETWTAARIASGNPRIDKAWERYAAVRAFWPHA